MVIFDEYGPVRMIRTRERKYVHRHTDGPHEMYDLVNDPDERSNLAGDASQAKRMAELKFKLEEWFVRFVDPSRDGIIDDGTDPPNYNGQIRFIKK